MTHVVPEHQRAAAERTLAATPGVRGEPSDAERARTLIAAVRTGALATIGEGGFPFGSLVSHAVDGKGQPLLLLSDLAEHSRNLAADPRASLMATQAGAGVPLALARVTVIGRVGELQGDERREWIIDPAELGIRRADPIELKGGTPKENAQVALEVLSGTEGAARDIVLLNAAAALLAADQAEKLDHAVEHAAEAIDSGKARSVLDRLVEVSNQAPTK